jgi:hypothetical protein
MSRYLVALTKTSRRYAVGVVEGIGMYPKLCIQPQFKNRGGAIPGTDAAQSASTCIKDPWLSSGLLSF